MACGTFFFNSVNQSLPFDWIIFIFSAINVVGFTSAVLLCFLSYFFFLIAIFCFCFFGCAGSSLLCVGFLYLRPTGATVCWGAWVSHCGGFSCCRAQAIGAWASVVVARGLKSAGSVVVAHRLSCSAACGIFPDQGLNPCPLHWQSDSQPLRHPGRPLLCFLCLVTTLFFSLYTTFFYAYKWMFSGVPFSFLAWFLNYIFLGYFLSGCSRAYNIHLNLPEST